MPRSNSSDKYNVYFTLRYEEVKAVSISPISSATSMRNVSSTSSDDTTMLQKLQKLLAQLREQLAKIEEMSDDSMTKQQLEDSLRTRISQVYAKIMAMKNSY